MTTEKTERLPTEGLSLQGNEIRLHYFTGEEGKPEEYLVVSRGAADSLIHSLAEQIRESGFRADIIVAVVRGGATPGRQLADYLGDLSIVPVTIASGYSVDGKRLPPVIIQGLPPLAKVEEQLRNVEKFKPDQRITKVLVVDEVVDHSDTSELARRHVEQIWRTKRKAMQIKFAALFVKNQAEEIDYYQERAAAWIIFPWEIKETITALYHRWKKYETRPSLDDTEIKKRLKELGFSEQDIEKFWQEK